MAVPTSQRLISSLINQLSLYSTVPSGPSILHPPPTNPPTNIASLHWNADLRPVMLTLHATFPDTLLPALDLLDRGLVTRFILDPSETSVPQTETNEASTTTSRALQSTRHPIHEPRLDPTFQDTPIASFNSQSVYYVRSAASISSSSHAYASPHHYEVRLSAWNCTCPAFVFSAFKEQDLFEDSSVVNSDWGYGQSMSWDFGGLSKEAERGGEVPVCKHLLACVLGEKGGAVCERMIEIRRVKRDEWVGWGTGWGD